MNDFSHMISTGLKEIYPETRASALYLDLSSPLPAPETFLVTAELEILEQFNLIKRRKQWLGGRLAVKKALLQTKGASLKEWEIINEKDGRPRAVFIPDPGGEPAISISHSHDLAAALTSGTVACGIDIERLSRRPLRLAERFSTRREAELLTAAPQKTGFTLLWCAKESLRKGVRPMPGFFDLELINLEPTKNGYIMDFKQRDEKWRYRCLSTLINDYGLSLFIAA